jgi:hypothetical protein
MVFAVEPLLDDMCTVLRQPLGRMCHEIEIEQSVHKLLLVISTIIRKNNRPIEGVISNTSI